MVGKPPGVFLVVFPQQSALATRLGFTLVAASWFSGEDGGKTTWRIFGGVSSAVGFGNSTWIHACRSVLVLWRRWWENHLAYFWWCFLSSRLWQLDLDSRLSQRLGSLAKMVGKPPGVFLVVFPQQSAL